MSNCEGSLSVGSVAESDRIHSLPCNIDHNGEANISTYFDTTVRSTEQQELEASFRGRCLKGSTINVPVGYTGYVFKEERKPITDQEDRVLRATHKFSQFNYWNLETLPSENDAMIKAMQWIDIASVLHKVEDDTVNATPETIR
ncbi:ribonuclease H2 subunit C [Exaiptasia diaphana]|uniref:Uncharacterized protein n=1 Tax=Exaiptasia diaphana TaxID=2652724 RepID=A0A913X502_EXADI|nr:ribonuclease H2 subunit C [Exaiptasia diaphana]KXJ27137.1 Ribonuclease H2 subunit C [Exaiptasia diaphana]